MNALTDFVEDCERRLRKGLPLTEEDRKGLRKLLTAFRTGGFNMNSGWARKAREALEH